MLCCKFVFFVLNFLLFGLGLAVAIFGILTLTDPEFLEYHLNLPINEFYNASYIVIVIGFVLVVIGFIGCCGAILDNACLLCLFSFAMILLLLLGIAAALVVWLSLHSSIVRGFLEKELFDKLKNTKFFGSLEAKLKCCGVKSQEDYKDEVIPSSCRDDKGNIYPEGCLKQIEILLKEKAAILGGMSSTIAVLAIVACIIGIFILCAVRSTVKSPV